jgi:hypothetical protein
MPVARAVSPLKGESLSFELVDIVDDADVGVIQMAELEP